MRPYPVPPSRAPTTTRTKAHFARAVIRSWNPREAVDPCLGPLSGTPPPTLLSVPFPALPHPPRKEVSASGNPVHQSFP